MQPDSAFVKSVFDALRTMTDPLHARIRELEAQIKELKPGRDGKDGKDGRDGRDAEQIPQEKVDQAIKLEVKEYLLAHPPTDGKDGVDGKDGKDGKDAEPVHLEVIEGAIKAQVAEYLTAHPPAAGPPGAKGEDGADGKDAEPVKGDVIRMLIQEELALNPPAAGPPGPPGDRGADGLHGKDGIGLAGALLAKDGHLVVTLSNGETKDVGLVTGADGVGTPGKDGKDGRDGVGHDDVEESLEDDGRFLVRRYLKDGVVVKEFRHKTANAIFRGVFDESRSYDQGDMTQWGGSMYIAKRATSMKPAELGENDWQIAVRRGRDGKAAPVKVVPAVTHTQLTPSTKEWGGR